MSGLAGLSIAKGLLGGAMGLVRRIGAWLGQLQPFQALSLALGLLSAFLWLHGVHSRHAAAKWKGLAEQCAELRKGDRRHFEAAAKQAQADQAAQIVKVNAQQAQISTEVNHDYETQLAALRLAAGRLRASRPDTGRANGVGASPVPDGAPGVNGEAVPRDQPDLGYTAEVELQLNALVDWVQRQTGVDPNAKP